ncbi:uncharacterized protein LOC144469515 [Augochlora pura]
MRFPRIPMESKVSFWISLIVPIVAMTNCVFAHESIGEITRTVRGNEGVRDNGDHEVNAGLRGAYKEHGVGDRYNRLSYKDGNTFGGVGSVHNSPGKLGGDDSDGYNHDFEHDYHHSHGYRSYHHHFDDDKDGDDGYHRYYRVHLGHDDGDKSDGNHGLDRDDHKNSGYHYNNEFEIHFGDSGKESGEQEYIDDSDHNGYGKHYEHSNKQSLNVDHNKGVDGRETDYHYGYTGRGGSYEKDYPSFRYRHDGRDHDRWAYRHGFVHGDR